MKSFIVPVVLMTVPLAACGSKSSVNEKNASVEEVSQKVAEASGNGGLIDPGLWQSTVTIQDMSMPGMPAQAQEQMKRMVAQTHTSQNCLTPEEVKQPKGKFFGGNDNCRYDHFTMSGGKIDAAMRCTESGRSQLMQMSGTYSPDAYSMQMSSRSEGGPADEAVSMQMKVDAKRIGPCTGKES
jgi:hypothetical protein